MSADDPSAVVGPRIREFRNERGLTLRSLASQAGLSIGFLSQVERGISSIGLTALGSVASALGRSVAEFFEDPENPAGPEQAGPEQAPRIPKQTAPEARHFTLTRGETTAAQFISGQTTYRMLSDRGAGLVLEPMLVRIAPRGQRENAYGHAGEEFAYVISGELLYEVDGVEHRLRPGDSVHLRSSTPHSLYNDTDEVTTVVSVVTPRLF